MLLRRLQAWKVFEAARSGNWLRQCYQLHRKNGRPIIYGPDTSGGSVPRSQFGCFAIPYKALKSE